MTEYIRHLNKQNLGPIHYNWYPWTGCFKISEACLNCYIPVLHKFIDCYTPLSPTLKDLPDGTVVYVALKSDFFLAEADKYRNAAWHDMKINPQLIFLIITKRADRIKECLPEDWGDGWDNVIINVTAENQTRADERIPLLLDIPCKHKWITCTPLLEEIDLTEYLQTGQIEHVELCGDKSYQADSAARPLDIRWAKNLKEQCQGHKVRLSFLTAGHNCILESGESIYDPSTCYHSKIADDLDISYYQPLKFKLPWCEIDY
jgi:protein gp37